MNKLLEIKNKLSQWFVNLSKSKKIAYSLLAGVIVVALSSFIIMASKVKYDVLFSNMTSEDSGAIVAKLKEKKAQYKITGNSILVPKGNIDSLRMELMSEVDIKEGSNGFELFDNGKMAPTDKETSIMYQRALAGEIERAIKSFPEIEGAKVNLVLPENTAFVRETEPASASVVIKLKAGTKLNNSQVKAIVSLLTGAVENLPKENVSIVSDKFELLTEGLYEEEKDTLIGSTDKQQLLKAEIEKGLEAKIMKVLEPIYKNGVKVSVNTDLDFDALQKNSVKYEPQGTIVSSHEVETVDNGSTTGVSSSPVDNATQNTTPVTTNNGNVVNKDITKNFEISKIEESSVKAPGGIKKITTSVVLDGNLDENTRTAVNNLVINAIGYSETRGDSISVEGLDFNSDSKKETEKVLQDIEDARKLAEKQALYTRIGFAAAAIILFVILLFAIRRSKKKANNVPEGIDMVIGDEIAPKQQEVFAPIEFEVNDKNSHMEKEVKKYAAEKPEQVADIVKSWLTEDER
ncbi:flagellar M-ring protein FliF [Clostridium sp. CS001]|uniref:flagellar basal-body MS-ring/collar protein FliF n=1 Tax=Clostridium sp. CS001 TaxID=2880648 RepID=UPI001CF47F3A|nr:flagellar basal-body MS-ring/collar protein FliF [Clostridium sp. CS001]MCB2288870.1 flagellar M-ring protein FliF [Clostridium sp. CS001]